VVFPWVRAEVVDDHGEPLPPGTVGRIRLQADAMATGYVNDPAPTAVMFRDGWFYPGDMGSLDGARRLQVAGRVDELLNIGGQKLSPSDLEAMVLRHATVTDVGVCSLPNANGVEEIHVAVTGAQGGDQELLQQIGRAFAAGRLSGFYVFPVDRIPRNANGKIERRRLKELIAAQKHTRQPRSF
jgi:acyl-CoA synthetase (AMP-forming)/AMP-acid ligase II